ncbi:hypothetical protein ACEPPN_012220 [Leptodophora sp. 'Broadleaf-Isolate-01']
MANIPIFYRIFFLYIDPLICLIGVYTYFFDHATFIESGTPHSISATVADTQHLSPLEQFLLPALGSYALCIFGIQILLLHQFHDVKIWRIVMFSILLTDLGLSYVVYSADPLGFWDVRGWTGGDWTNNGILGAVIAIRTAFLLGIGGVEV